MSAPAAVLGKLDLVTPFGHEAPELLMHFDTLELAGSFIRRYAFNNNKCTKRPKGHGNYKKWLCSDAEGGCSWSITLSRKRGSTISADTSKKQRKKPKTKLSHVPDNAWYISKMNLQHGQLCGSIAEMRSAYLLEQPGFAAAIVEGHSTSLARVMNNMEMIHGVNLKKQSVMVYKTIQRAKAKNKVDPVAEYGCLPSFLKEFAKMNSDSRVCCQLDSHGGFFRAFLSIGSVVHIQDDLLPVWECDGTHMKDPLYNGVCLSLIGKYGDKQNVPVAVAYVHKETVDNFAWFFCNCIVAGLKLHDRPTFCDRGKQLGAQAVLNQIGLEVHLKFCCVHIRFNTMDKIKSLKLKMQSVKDDIFALQSASTTARFDHVIGNIANRYPTGITKVVADKLVEEHVWGYLRQIHPTDWSVVGNMQPTPNDTTWLTNSWGNTAKHGNPLPLFGCRTTSAVEGENNGLLWNRVRNKLVLGSLKAYCLRAHNVIEKRKKLVKEWTDAVCDITPHALRLFDEEKTRVSQQNVVAADPPLFCVFDAFDSRSGGGNAHLYEVSMTSRSCTRCTVTEQLKVPCRHIQAVAFWRSKMENGDLPEYDVKLFFHQAYTVPNMRQAFDSISIRLPLHSKLQQTDEVRPPPLYRQAGSSLSRRKETTDIDRGSKRKNNRGECAGSATHRDQSSTTAVFENDDESKDIAAFFSTQVKAPSTVKRNDYRCSKCGQLGHNIRRCTNPDADLEETGGILPGAYVVDVHLICAERKLSTSDKCGIPADKREQDTQYCIFL